MGIVGQDWPIDECEICGLRHIGPCETSRAWIVSSVSQSDQRLDRIIQILEEILKELKRD